MEQIWCRSYRNGCYICHSLNSHFHFVVYPCLLFESISNSDPFVVQILWLKISMVLCSCKLWIQILEIFNKSLPHIIFNKWTLLDLMFNLMVVYITWRVRSWNFVHTMNSSTPIPWDSSNNVSVLLIKSRFTIFYFDIHKYTFYYYWFCS